MDLGFASTWVSGLPRSTATSIHPFVQYAKVTLLEISPCQCPIVKRSGVAYSCSYALLMRRKGGIATWVLTCQNQNGVVIDRGNQVNNLRPPRLHAQQGAGVQTKRQSLLVDVPLRVSLFQTCCLSWLLAPWLYQVLGISWSVVFSSSELELPGSAFFARISELERRGSEDDERRDDSPWRERRRAVGKVLPAE